MKREDLPFIVFNRNVNAALFKITVPRFLDRLHEARRKQNVL